MAPQSRLSLRDTIMGAIAATGKSVNAVATESGVSQPILHRFVTGQRGINLKTADRLCAYLQLELMTHGGSRTIEE